MSENTQVVRERADLESAMLKATETHDAVVEKMQGEIADAQSASAESKAALDAAVGQIAEANDRLVALEQREEVEAPAGPASIGETFIKSDAYTDYIAGRTSVARMDMKTAIINTYPASSVQPLVQGDRIMSIHATPNRRLTLRDILPVGPTDSNLVEFTRENALTPLRLAA